MMAKRSATVIAVFNVLNPSPFHGGREGFLQEGEEGRGAPTTTPRAAEATQYDGYDLHRAQSRAKALWPTYEFRPVNVKV
ncbi:MAG: hypothetical protein WC683_13110 [bacterium]